MKEPILDTAAALYAEMKHRGLEIRKTEVRDTGLFNELLKSLDCPDDNLIEFLRQNNISAKQFLLKFLKVVEPFSQMFLQIWMYLAKHCAPKAADGQSITIRYGLNEDNEQEEINLEQFRRYAEATRLIDMVIQYNIWSNDALGTLFDLQRILNVTQRSQSYQRYRPGKAFQLPAVNLSDNPMDKVINEIRTVMQEIINGYKNEPKSRETENYTTLGNLAMMLTDLLPGWYAIFENTAAIPHEIKLQAYAYYQEHTEPLLSVENRMSQQEIRDALDTLDLPFWKHRWHTYEIWTTVYILENLMEYNPIPRLKDDRICLDGYSSEIIADLTTSAFPDACAAIQVQTNIKIGNKKAMKPDLRICYNTSIEDPDNTAAVIEFKQRNVITKEHIEEISMRYSKGALKSAGVIISNYDKPGISPILTGQNYYIEGVHPGNESALDIFKSTLSSILYAAGFEQKKNLVVLMDISTSMSRYYENISFNNIIPAYVNNEKLKIYYFNSKLVYRHLSIDNGYKISTAGGTDLTGSMNELMKIESVIDRLLIVTDGEDIMPEGLLAEDIYSICFPHEMKEKLTWLLE